MGLTIVDAGVLIGFLDASDEHHPASAAAVRAASARGDAMSIPASALAEALVGPARRGTSAVRRVRELLERLPLTVAAADAEVATIAAGLRAKHGGKLRLPDALVVATAVHLGADVLLTTDRRWPTARALGLDGRLVTV